MRSGLTAAAPGEAPSIEVALATYQSERFLRPLLDSLFAQSEQNFTLLVADDGSTDATMRLIDEYSAKYDGRIRLIARDRQQSGALGNFGRLLEHVSEDYLMLCDHDDVWLPDKIAMSLERMRELEAAHGAGVPLLVHSDLIVVDEHLEPISPSLFAYSGFDPARNDVVSLLTANVATGCTILVNRALYERARPIPPEAMMHDHWLALVAATLGAISCIARPTILYRQHGANVIGAQRSGTTPLIERIGRTLFGNDRQAVMRRKSRQAAALLDRYGDEMREDERRAVATFARIWSISRWRRFAELRRNGLALPGLLRNAALLVVVTRAK
jgi:glycosyltransferase involved in cell wall biosynthesis